MAAHGSIGFAAGLMILVAFSGAIGAGTVWFSNNDGKVSFTLWHIEMELIGVDDTVQAKHDEVCELSGSNEALDSYCLKIRATRATTILTAILGFLTAVLLMLGYCKHRPWMIWTAIFLALLTVTSACAAVGLGKQLEVDNTLLTMPKIGFYMMVFAIGASGMALILAILGNCIGGSSKDSGGGGASYAGYGKRQPVGLKQPPPMPQMMPVTQYGAPQSVAPPGGYNPGSGGDFGLSAPHTGAASTGHANHMPPLPVQY